ncbi:hypothetical protein N1028_00685 [Herbiconiux sp. CPCC 203407]|uniref:Uncharacterized protein n=1 Tax=Herbiconiux oxytropis TaxID=2970915 RepID=A0AA42BVF8_9MICO|nr:hypothetical protein [Herbiconiux oxytropis]MCS5720926.1 hypothetical protein [Herbiconiux oxytropis]MCS5724403.1 hypothetical protein [Herbiconiux oxytropis]
MTNHHPTPKPPAVGRSDGSRLPADGYAVWYLIGATFLFAGAAFAFTMDLFLVGILGLAAGAVVAAAGLWVWRRAHVAGRADPQSLPHPQARSAPAPERPGSAHRSRASVVERLALPDARWSSRSCGELLRGHAGLAPWADASTSRAAGSAARREHLRELGWTVVVVRRSGLYRHPGLARVAGRAR